MKKCKKVTPVTTRRVSDRSILRKNVRWDVLQDIFDRYSDSEIKSNLDYFPKRIGIDEFAYRKGKKEYAVVIVDLDKSCVWEVLEDRSKRRTKSLFLSKGEAFCRLLDKAQRSNSVIFLKVELQNIFFGSAKEVMLSTLIICMNFFHQRYFNCNDCSNFIICHS